MVFGRSSGVIWGDLGTFSDIFGPSLKRLGDDLGPSWLILWRLGAISERPGTYLWPVLEATLRTILGRLGASREVLGRSWVFFGTILGRLESQGVAEDSWRILRNP